MGYSIQRWDKANGWIHLAYGGGTEERAKERMKKYKGYAHLASYVLRVVPETKEFGYN